MCLAVPGKIINISDEIPLFRTGRIDFSGVTKEVSLAYVPEANIDDYVIVHAGFTLSIVDEKEAMDRNFNALSALNSELRSFLFFHQLIFSRTDI